MLPEGQRPEGNIAQLRGNIFQCWLRLTVDICFVIMDWAVDTTGLIITSVTCCGQEAQSEIDTSGGRSGTRSCWWMVDQICADPVWPPTPKCVILRTLLQLTCMWNANQLCPSRVFPVQRVWCQTESLCSSDSPCISCTAHPDAGSHDEVAHRIPAWELVCYPYEWHVHTIGAVQSAEVPQFHWCCIFSV